MYFQSLVLICGIAGQLCQCCQLQHVAGLLAYTFHELRVTWRYVGHWSLRVQPE